MRGWIYNFGAEEECSHYTTVVPKTEKFCTLQNALFLTGLPEAHFPLQDLQYPQSKKFMCLILEEVEMARSEAFVASQQQRVDKINTTNDRHPHLMKIGTRFNIHS